MTMVPRRPSMLELIARHYLASAVSRVTYFVLLMALLPVCLVIVFALFLGLFAIIDGLFVLVGRPPALEAVASAGAGLGSLLGLFLILLRGHRWLTRLLAIADAPARFIDPSGAAGLSGGSRTRHRKGPRAGFRDRLAAADARHAPPGTTRDERRIAGRD